MIGKDYYNMLYILLIFSFPKRIKIIIIEIENKKRFAFK